jgi:hypothetical protein
MTAAGGEDDPRPFPPSAPSSRPWRGIDVAIAGLAGSGRVLLARWAALDADVH